MQMRFVILTLLHENEYDDEQHWLSVA